MKRPPGRRTRVGHRHPRPEALAGTVEHGSRDIDAHHIVGSLAQRFGDHARADADVEQRAPAGQLWLEVSGDVGASLLSAARGVVLVGNPVEARRHARSGIWHRALARIHQRVRRTVWVSCLEAGDIPPDRLGRPDLPNFHKFGFLCLDAAVRRR
jgi:hypothetical protein